jgi:hypothetical protein
VPSSQGDRDRRAEERKQRREEAHDRNTAAADDGAEDSAEEAGNEGSGVHSSEREGSTLRTGATLAAAGAVVGAAVGAASALRSRHGGDGADAETEADPERAAAAERDTDALHADPEDGDDAGLGDDAAPAGPENGGRAAGFGEARQSEDGDAAETPQAAENGAEGERGGNDTDAEIEPGSAAAIVRQARDQLSELTGRESEGALGFERTEKGWLVQVELVELKRIPSTTDVLGVYDVQLDDQGAVQDYRRTNRYVRSQAGGGA